MLAKTSPYAQVSRNSPNADKLVDGAIQRQSVQPGFYDLAVKVNTDKVGVYKRPQHGMQSSGSVSISADPMKSFSMLQGKIARIYMP